MDASTREALLEQLRIYLEADEPDVDTNGDRDIDTVGAGAEAGGGAGAGAGAGTGPGHKKGDDEPEAPDLFTLLAELAALKNEVRVESRQVKAALDQFGAVFDTVREGSQRLQEELGRQRERATADCRQSEQDLLLDLLDLHDRLLAGSEQAARYTPGWLARRGGAGAFVGGMAQGMTMNLRRLDEVLVRRGVRPLEALHQPFDPHTMRAVETTQDPALPDGVVTGVLQNGFQRDGQLLRIAEVVVNKA